MCGLCAKFCKFYLTLMHCCGILIELSKINDYNGSKLLSEVSESRWLVQTGAEERTLSHS